MSTIAPDVRLAGRLLTKSPLFTTIVVTTIALAIGLNTAVFSAIDTLLLKPLPGVRAADEIVQLYRSWPGDVKYGSNSLPHFQDLRDRTGDAFSGVALIMGVYLQPVSETVRQVGLFGFDVSKATKSTYEGRPVTIVGADSPADSTSEQFWIEDERQVLVRVRGAARGTGRADVHVGGYVAHGAALGAQAAVAARRPVLRLDDFAKRSVESPHLGLCSERDP
ncbi:MAG: hypothetical protein O2973_08510 [Gemmatimonadetes bacterium]|nr:hypothetical protein [Gemmatimonadota bacterium]